MKYSIITVNYNNRDGLRKTIVSVVSQSYKDFEYIIIDGGSTDGSCEVIEEFADQITYWVSEPDKGIYNAMNKGIKAAHGEYLNFMNSGDCFYDENVLKNTLQYLTAEIVHGRLFYNSGRERSVYLHGDPDMQHFIDNTLNHQSSFIARKLFDGTLYDEQYKIVSDWKFFMEKLILQNCSFLSIPVKVGIFEEGGISESNSSLDAKERKEVLQQMFPPRIMRTFERFKGKESPMLDLIPQFNRTYGLQNFIITTVKSILFIYRIINKFKCKH